MNDILDAGASQQLSMDTILEVILQENRDDAFSAVSGSTPAVATERPEPHNGYPSGWMYQMGKKQSVGDALVEAKAQFRARFRCEPKTIWMNPLTGDDGDQVSHDGRIGKNYILLGPLPPEQGEQSDDDSISTNEG